MKSGPVCEFSFQFLQCGIEDLLYEGGFSAAAYPAHYAKNIQWKFNCDIFSTVEDILYTQAGYYGLSRKEVTSQLEFLLEKLGRTDTRTAQAITRSGGMKRRLMIARALMHKPKLLFLDEPTAGVDIELRREMWDFLKELNQSGVTIILTTHYLEEAEKLCKHLAIISGGEIKRFGTMDGIRNGRPLEEVYLEATA